MLVRRRLLCVLPLTLAVMLSLLLLRRAEELNWRWKESPSALPAGGVAAASVTGAAAGHRGLPASALRVVHLDLKGAPPRISYLRRLLPLLAAHGCTALLIEYEDMFPYQGALVNISAANAYTQQQVLELISWARHLGMDVIPLVQTFGHLEFVLKLAQFRDLRELDSFPQEVCPKAPDTMKVIKEMIQQVMALHPSARYLHIGCDEVYHLASCPRCSKTGKGSREIFTEHVQKVAELVRSLYPGVVPLIWDDMLRRWDPSYLSRSPLGALVQPVVWAYTDSITRLVPHYLWHWYSKVFPKIWVAGAFKGANLPTSILPDLRMHYNNQKSWLRFIENSKTEIAGYVLTGWSRYDHFATLCELLPPSVPSLMLNLILICNQEGDEAIIPKWHKSIHCPLKSTLTIDSTTTNHRPLSMCAFPGLSSFLMTSKYLTLKGYVDRFYEDVTEKKAWMTPYNVKHNFSSPHRVLEDFRLQEGYKLIKEVRNFMNESRVVLLEYFDSFTADEWIEQRIKPMDNKLAYLETVGNQLSSRRSWPRRPFGT